MSAKPIDMPHLAPVYPADVAREKMCPLLSSLNEDKTITRVNCMAGTCALWDWVLGPSIPSTIGLFAKGAPPLPPETTIGPFDSKPFAGLGKCSIPRRSYMAARALRDQARKK